MALPTPRGILEVSRELPRAPESSREHANERAPRGVSSGNVRARPPVLSNVQRSPMVSTGFS
eukprot:2220133-Alexandrium_andersonii.AAC.1